MSRKAQGLAAVVCIGLGVLLGALMNEALNRPASAAGEQTGGRNVVWSGSPSNVNYRVQGQVLQKAMHVNEIALHDGLLVFRDGSEIRAAVSLFALTNFQVVAGE